MHDFLRLLPEHVVSGAAGVIGGNTNIDVDAALSSMQAGLDAMEIPELLLLVMETSLVSLCMKIMSVLITVILYGRMIEIYLYCSVSPIPFATMTNREWGQIGNNYLKALFALGFQGFLIMICVGIYAVLVGSMIVADNLHSAILDYVDKKRLQFTVAVDISYIDKEIQTWLFEYIKENGTVKAVQVAALRTALEVGPMTQAKMISILVNSQPGRKQEQKITFSEKKLRNFFSDKYTAEDMESVILELLDQWKRGEITV